MKGEVSEGRGEWREREGGVEGGRGEGRGGSGVRSTIDKVLSLSVSTLK